jgi:hypothetical protein
VVISVGIIRGVNQISPEEVVDISETFEEEIEALVLTPVFIKPDESLLPVDEGTLEVLEKTTVPVVDLNDLARRLEGKKNIPLAQPLVREPLTPGTVDSFWVTNTDTNESFQIEAVLRYVTEHTYFWIENGLGFNEGDLRNLAVTFENVIYPLNREYFGSEWIPGIDGDPHLYVIYAGGLGRNLAGYFSSTDEYHYLAHEYSNMHETFMLNADNLQLNEDYTYGVLAHEFQHMIHWYQDRNEETWLNEGFSELAAHLNGYELGGFDYLYASNPDLQLTDWPNDPDETAAHYGASFLYITYLLDRFGISVVKALVEHPDNGMKSIDEVLRSINASDPLTGQSVDGDDLFLDWTLASYLKDSSLLDGRYGYTSYTSSPRINDTEVVKSCSTTWEVREVHQYGVDYIRIPCAGDYILRFEGSVETRLLPVDPHSGEFSFWSNKGDDSNMTLTRTFDLTEAVGDLSLTYWTWYNIEEDYDYVYLEASLDGELWQILKAPSVTLENPSGNSLGWSYNGLSGGNGTWTKEKVDISQFVGQEVMIRFEYVTDAAVNGEGFLLDDIAIPAIGYFCDFETDDGGWEELGFVRIKNSLPQMFRLAIIEKGETTNVRYLELDDNNGIEVPLQVSEDGEEVILVITATTRYTRQKAGYQYQVQAK